VTLSAFTRQERPRYAVFFELEFDSNPANTVLASRLTRAGRRPDGAGGRQEAGRLLPPPVLHQKWVTEEAVEEAFGGVLD
jgi:hypothetical protein